MKTPTKEKRAIAQYAIVYVDKNNKINNLVTNMRYNIDSRENFLTLSREMLTATQGNFRAILNIMKLCDLKPKGRKKKDESKTN